ncbi:helix-turn-helix domain-containing protein [Aurantibacter sp.]|uniref:helix-turn-helix domain-containing protein n=1 Tax=Aurantibacter sp. TaxID=2807103 RepID=UPI0035C87460
MINNTEFSKRLQKVIDYHQESASGFANKIGVQRSSISHILSGRNKPSLEFVMKVLDTFPEVELYWLLNGKGTFPKTDVIEKIITPTPISKSPVSNFENSSNQNSPDLFSKKVENEKTENSQDSDFGKMMTINSKGKQIERIVIFYKDGSFSNFENS